MKTVFDFFIGLALGLALISLTGCMSTYQCICGEKNGQTSTVPKTITPTTDLTIPVIP